MVGTSLARLALTSAILAALTACSGDATDPRPEPEPPIVVEGRILLDTGEGLAGQRISLKRAPAFHEWAFTDEQGFYRIEAKSNLWNVEFATTRGYEDPEVEPIQVDLLPGESVTLDPVIVRRRVHEVPVFNDRIEPREITIGTGAIIRWTIQMPGAHTIGNFPVGDYWVSGLLAEGESYERVFDQPVVNQHVRCFVQGHPHEDGQFITVVDGF